MSTVDIVVDNITVGTIPVSTNPDPIAAQLENATACAAQMDVMAKADAVPGKTIDARLKDLLTAIGTAFNDPALPSLVTQVYLQAKYGVPEPTPDPPPPEPPPVYPPKPDGA